MEESVMHRLGEVAQRIEGMREVVGFSQETMAQKTGVSLAEYQAYEKGEVVHS